MRSFKRLRRKIRYAFLYWFVRALIFLANIVPRVWWLSWCGALGKLAYYTQSTTRRLAMKNLRLAFPEKRDAEITALCKSFFVMLGKNAGDVLRAFHVRSLADLEKFMVVKGYHYFDVAFKKGNGVIFMASHLGAFDLMVTNFALQGFNPHVVGTPLKDKKLNELVWRSRNKFGAVAVERGKESTKLFKVLKQGGLVGLLIDQDTRVKSAFVQFFGRPAATPIGVAYLAMRTGAAVVPVFIHMTEEGKQEMEFLPEVVLRDTGDEDADVQYNTQQFSDIVERQIRLHPAQWVWMHERWKTQAETGGEVSNHKLRN